MLGCAVVVVMLAAAAGVATWRARDGREARDAAVVRLADVQNLTAWAVFDADGRFRSGPESALARRESLARAAGSLEGLNVESIRDDALVKDIARAYLRVASLQGGLSDTNIGDTAGALRTYRAALWILDALWQRHPDDEWVGTSRFLAVCNLSMMTANPSDGAALAGRYMPELDAWLARDAGPQPLLASSLMHAGLGQTLRAMGALDLALGEFHTSETAARRASALLERDKAPRRDVTEGPEPSEGDFDAGLAVFARAETLLEMGRIVDALGSTEEARVLFEPRARATAGDKRGLSSDRMSARVHGLKAQALWELHEPARLDEALAEAKIEMTAATPDLQDGPAPAARELALAHRHRGNILVAKGDVGGGLAELQQAVLAIGEVADADPALLLNRALLAGILNDDGLAQLHAKLPDQAEAVFRRAWAAADQGANEGPDSVEVLRERARALSGVGRAVAARVGPSDARAREVLKQARADWVELRKRSPLDRRYLDEQRAVLTLGSTVKPF